jgi:transcriptional regulator with XRE-family HTH domain
MTDDDAAIKRRFGARLRELRKQAGLSQEALAHACDLDRTYVSSVERGERNVGLVNIERLAAGLGVSPREFFDG